MPNRTVLATGVFDVLHLGHIRFLEESKRLAGRGAKLVVVVARDKTVRRRKGRGPVFPEQQRRGVVEALKPVDRAILGRPEADYLAILRQERPDIVCVGYDQNDVKRAVKSIIAREKLPIKILQVRKFGPAGMNSSSRVKRRVAKTFSGRARSESE